MELWIRSQDKTELAQVDNLSCIENRIVFIPNNHGGRATVGKYKTKERALEVLDEIQSFINREDTLESSFSQYDIAIKSTKITCNVYEMPKE